MLQEGLCLLEDFLLKEYHFYQEIFAIIKEEKGKFERQRPLNEILPLIKKRMILFECIEELQKTLTPILQEWQQSANKDPLLSKTINRTQVLIKEILTLDKINQNSMKESLHSLKKKQSSAKAK